MIPTRHDLDSNVRETMVKLLNDRLVDSIDLYSHLKQAHWNVKGPNFIALHKLFDELAETIDEAIDDIAERAVALGGVAVGTTKQVASNTSLPAYPTDIRDGVAHVTAVANSLAAASAAVRKAIGASSEAGDEGTADLFTGYSRELDKALYFVEAHLQADK